MIIRPVLLSFGLLFAAATAAAETAAFKLTPEVVRNAAAQIDTLVAAGLAKNGSRLSALSTDEVFMHAPDVNWWKFSRKPAAEWIKASDTDRDGQLSTVEFTPLASGKNHVEAVFKRADKNRDGSLDAAETTAYLKSITEDSGSEPE